MVETGTGVDVEVGVEVDADVDIDVDVGVGAVVLFFCAKTGWHSNGKTSAVISESCQGLRVIMVVPYFVSNII